jgi:hypothetical protein
MLVNFETFISPNVLSIGLPLILLSFQLCYAVVITIFISYCIVK